MRSLVWSAVLLLLACGGEEAVSDPPAELQSAAKAAQPGGRLPTRAGASGAHWNRLAFHGGPLMMGPTSVYFIWYGAWTGSPVQPLLVDFATNLGGSQYFGVVASYPNAAGVAPANALVYSGAITDEYSMGATLSDSDIQLVVSQAVAGGQLPADPDAIYVVLPDPSVDATSGLCTSWCATHGTTNANGTTVKYAFIGNPARCPSSCAVQNPGPNGAGEGDAMASLLAAELFDSVTDPQFTGWYDQNRLEPASKCAWTFGTTYTAANGAKANVRLGSNDYLLQQLWVNRSVPPRTKGYCATALAP